MNKKKIFSFLKSLSRISFILFFALSLFNFGVVYGKYSDDNESILDFATKEREYKYNSRESVPQELISHIEDYNRISNSIKLAVLSSLLVIFFDYFIDPENHFYTKIKRKFKGIKIEDGDE